LRPLTYTTPKPLLPIANVVFLERQLGWLARHGIDETVLSLGYMPEAFVEHFADARFGDMHLRYAVEEEPLGTAGGIRFAADVGGIDERFVVCNGDVLTGLDLSALLAFHDDRNADATIHLARVPDPSAFGVVPTHPDGEVKAFVEKPPPGRAPTDWINAGTYVLEPSVLVSVPPRLAVSIERETFPRMLDRPGRLYGYPSDDYWIDIGTPEKYLEAHEDMLARAVGDVSMPAGAVETAPGIWFEGDVDIAAGAHVEAPALIGAGSIVASGARVTRSVLGVGCVVEAGSQIGRSVLLDRARVGPGAEVVESILGRDAVVGDNATVSEYTIVEDGGAVEAAPATR
jgi:NDP-sugar pyrophosphorylase family protein